MEDPNRKSPDLIGQLDQHRGLTETARRILRALHDGISASRFDMTTYQRGWFGSVLRWKRDGDLWVDALPVHHRVPFYINKSALHAPGLDYGAISRRLPHASERSDFVVKTRLHDRPEALTMAEMINDALGSKP